MTSFLEKIVEHHSLKLSSCSEEDLKDLSKLYYIEKVLSNAFEQDFHLESSQAEISELLYGEIELGSAVILLNVVQRIKPEIKFEECVFYDIGSGRGKVVFGCSLCKFWKSCYGIEIVRSLHDCACGILSSLIEQNENFKAIEFINADAFSYDYSDGDIIFMNCTAWNIPILKQLCKCLSQTKAETIVITTTLTLPDPNWTVVYTMYLPCSWGSTYFYVHLKRADYPRFRDLHLEQLTRQSIPEPLWPSVHEVSAVKGIMLSNNAICFDCPLLMIDTKIDKCYPYIPYVRQSFARTSSLVDISPSHP